MWKKTSSREQPLSRILTHRPHLIFITVVVLVLVMFIAAVIVLEKEREDSVSHATKNAENLALVVENDVTRTIQLLDLSMQAVADGATDSVVMDMPPNYRNQLLFDRSATAGQYLSSILFVDANGNVAVDPNSTKPAKTNFQNEKWFSAQKTSTSQGLYISPPFHATLRNNAWEIALSRRVSRKDGSFAGVVVATIDLNYFRNLLAGLSLEKGGAITLLTADGYLIMRTPNDDRYIGKNYFNSTNLVRYRTQHERSFFGSAVIDGKPRLYIIRNFTKAPFVISASPSVTEVYGDWRQRVVYIAFLSSIVAAVLLWLAWELTKEFKRRVSTEKELLLLSHIDGLTGLKNRHTLDKIFVQELARCQRVEKPLAILFIDIDFFKSYNDTYGHQAGDQTLMQVARALERCILRPGDVAARFGGEEFVVILPETSLKGASEVANRIHAAIHAQKIEHRMSEFQFVTVSIGITCSDAIEAPETSSLLRGADEALYQAKTDGRNRSSYVIDLPAHPMMQ